MKQWKSILAAALLCLSILSCNPASSAASSIDQVPVLTEIPNLGAAGDNPNPPANPVKLIFIHHSSGGDWLADPASNGLGGERVLVVYHNKFGSTEGWIKTSSPRSRTSSPTCAGISGTRLSHLLTSSLRIPILCAILTPYECL